MPCRILSLLPRMVPRTGIEPVRPLCRKAADFKSAVSTNFTIEALPPTHCPAKNLPPEWREAFQNGAGEESRTLDLNLGKVALYQLSYSRIRTKEVAYCKGRLLTVNKD